MVLGMEWDGCMTGAALVVWVVLVLLFGYGAVDTRERLGIIRFTSPSALFPTRAEEKRAVGEKLTILLQRCIGSLSGYSLAWIQTLVPASLSAWSLPYMHAYAQQPFRLPLVRLPFLTPRVLIACRWCVVSIPWVRRQVRLHLNTDKEIGF
jgi:hypothetical protein